MKQNLAYYSAVLGEDKASSIPAREVCVCVYVFSVLNLVKDFFSSADEAGVETS